MDPDIEALVKRIDDLEERNRSLERDVVISDWINLIAFLSCAVAILFRVDLLLWIAIGVFVIWCVLVPLGLLSLLPWAKRGWT